MSTAAARAQDVPLEKVDTMGVDDDDAIPSAAHAKKNVSSALTGAVSKTQDLREWCATRAHANSQAICEGSGEEAAAKGE